MVAENMSLEMARGSATDEGLSDIVLPYSLFYDVINVTNNAYTYLL